jgi:hypothetical protein
LILNIRALERYCSHLWVSSKEKGLCPLYLYGTQKYFLSEVVRQLNDGIHFFYVLKSRQQGITTVCLALDLFWLTINPGTQGSFVVEEDKKLHNHRATIDGFYSSLPKGLKVPIKTHNRNIFELRNRSKLLYQAAGIKVRGQKSTFGQSTGINFVHGTEMSSWVDTEAVANFVASLAETNPKRLYIFESTAKGYNDFEARWREAKNSVTKGTIFIGWWRMENYSIDPNDPDPNRRMIYKVYGEDAPTGEELIWIDQVREYYGHEITRPQLAWWRWKLAEEIMDERAMMQYYPPTEDAAFQLEGYKFFDLERLREVNKQARLYDEPTYFRYTFGGSYDQTNLVLASERFAQLRVWEDADPDGYYVIGADPAFGSSLTADRYAIEVFRCYTNRLVQVAEYKTSEGNCYTYAWILAHLCGWYRNKNLPTVLVLEINGPGKAVMDEFFRLQQYPQYSMPHSNNELMDVVGAIQNYLYTRGDAVGGSNYNYHWKTTPDLKEYIMNLYRDTFDSNKMLIKSHGEDSLIWEMQHIQQVEGKIESGSREVHDDLVMATALAIEGYTKMLLPDLYSVGHSYEAAHREGQQTAGVLNYSLQNYLSQFRKELQ